MFTASAMSAQSLTAPLKTRAGDARPGSAVHVNVLAGSDSPHVASTWCKRSACLVQLPLSETPRTADAPMAAGTHSYTLANTVVVTVVVALVVALDVCDVVCELVTVDVPLVV